MPERLFYLLIVTAQAPGRSCRARVHDLGSLPTSSARLSLWRKRTAKAVLIGWVFLISRMIGMGVMIPENAVWAKDLEMCNAIRETVELIVDPGVVVSECKDDTKKYLGLPIYRGGPK